MADTKTEEQEPSIEDILESIRQIISDEDEEEIKDGGKLEAEEEIEDKPSDIELPSEEDDYTPADIEGDMTEEEAEEEVLVLNDVVEDATSGGELKAEDEAEDTPSDIELPKEEDDYTPADIEGSAEDEEEIAANIVMEEVVDDSSGALMAEETEVAATDAFAKLADNVYVEDERTTEFVTQPGRITLEQMTRELMRPMIKEWLDAHLPDLVENLVQKEIQKLSDRAKK